MSKEISTGKMIKVSDSDTEACSEQCQFFSISGTCFLDPTDGEDLHYSSTYEDHTRTDRCITMFGKG